MTGESAKIWMPLFIGDYLSATSRLTTEQHGAYLLLIMDYWRNGPPPDDDRILAQITRMSVDAWSITQAFIKPFFRIENGMLKHDRIESEKAKAQEKSGKSKEKAVKAAAARWGNRGENAPSSPASNAPSIPQALHELCPSPSPSPSPLEKDKDQKRKEARGTRLPTDWTLPPSWRDWALTEKPGWDQALVEREGHAFADYWQALPGARAVKLDWEKTWHNWVRSSRTQPTKPMNTKKTPAPDNFDAVDYGKGGLL